MSSPPAAPRVTRGRGKSPLVSMLTVWRRNPWTLLLALPVIILWIGGWKYHWMSDDGFINLRVTKQLLAGHGPVFNRGERVEATTSPLWMYLLVAAGALTPFRLEWIAVTLGILRSGCRCGTGSRPRLRPYWWS